MAEAGAFCCAFDEAGNVGHHEAVVFIHAHHAEIGVQGGEGVVGDFGARGRHGADQGGFAGIGHAEQADIGQHFQFELQGACFALFAGCGVFGCAVD